MPNKPAIALDQLKDCQLVALRISNDALGATELPKRIKLLAWGSNPTHAADGKPGRPLIVDDRTLEVLPHAQGQLGFDRVALDYNHNSVPGHPEYQPNPRKVAAYGVPEVVKGEGLFLGNIEWTPSGRDYAKEYRDLSPTPLLDTEGRVLFLHSAALCHQGKVAGLSFFSADFLAPAAPVNPAAPGKLSPMNPDLQKLLCVLFGAPETANEAELLSAGKAFAERLGKTDTTLQAMNQRLDVLEKGQEAPAREAVIQAAIAAGKVVPQSVRDLPLEAMKKVIADLPAGTVPTDRQTPHGVQPHSAGTPAAGEVAAIQANLGISPEAWKKHNPDLGASVVT